MTVNDNTELEYESDILGEKILEHKEYPFI